MAENYKEQQQEENEGIVDAGGFENEPGTGLVAEEQETAAAAEAQPAPAEAVPAYDDSEAVAEAKASESVQIDLHEDTGSGIDIAVIIIVLLIIIGCLSFGIANAPTEEEQLIIAQQQAAQQSEEYEPPYEVAELPEGVAAVVNGEYIAEATINDYVTRFRAFYGLEDDGDWSAWMIEAGYAPEMVRDMGITAFVSEAIVRQGVEEFDIVVPESAVEEIYRSNRALFGTDEEWQDALEQAGQTEESFRQQCWQDAAQQAFMDYLGKSSFATSAEEDAAVLDAVSQYYPEYAEATSLTEVPADMVEPVREMVIYYAAQDAFTEYAEGIVAEGGVKMSLPPADLPYNSNSLAGVFQAITDQVAAQQAE